MEPLNAVLLALNSCGRSSACHQYAYKVTARDSLRVKGRYTSYLRMSWISGQPSVHQWLVGKHHLPYSEGGLSGSSRQPEGPRLEWIVVHSHIYPA